MKSRAACPFILVASAGLCAGVARAQVAVDADPGPDLGVFGVTNEPLAPGHAMDFNGLNDPADKNPAASIERARASWPFRISKDEAEARMASDAGEIDMLARLDARGIALQPADRPNYYYYKGHPIAMDLDVTRVAIMLADTVPAEAMKQAATVAARNAGLAPAAAMDTHAQSGHWVLVTLQQPLTGYEDADARLNAFANAPGVVIASPVFHNPAIAGGYLTITPDILARVAPDRRNVTLETIAAKAPNLAVFNPSLGNMAGAVQLRSTARNGFDVLAEANRLCKDLAFAWAEPDLRGTLQIEYVPNDPTYWDQWQHDNNGTNGGVADQDMDSDIAWDYTRGVSAIDVLVMDVGTQSDHADINWQNGRDFTTGVVGGVGTGDPTWACDNHGTAVAGIITQRNNNSALGSGTAPGCNVLCAKIGDSTIHSPPCSTSFDAQTSYVANALAWGASNGADVSNSSFSWTPNTTMSDAYQNTAVNNNILHMASNGNSGDSFIAFPANAAYVYGIVNLTNTGNRNSSSQYGTGTDFSAPGSGCRTTDREGAAGYTNTDEVYFSGTSCASPNAAGVAAMFNSAYQWATRSQVYTGVADGCRDRGTAGYDTEYGYGFVNSYYSIVDVNPSNDRCSGAIAIPSGTLSYSYDNLNTTWATDGWNEPQASCESGAAGEGASVWWRWTAPNTGSLDINTNGTDYDTVLSIWDGCGAYNASGGYSADTLLACDDDGGTGTQSQILNFPVHIGDTYYIKASAYGDTNPGGLLDIAFVLTPTPPSNDSCASPTVVPGTAYGSFNPAILDTDHATVASCENQESCEAGNVGVSNSVWYQFTPFEDGEITVDTEGSDYDTVVAIFPTGCATNVPPFCFGSTALACDDDGGTGTLSLISSFVVDQGETYYIKVSDYGSEGGGALDFNLLFSPPAVPANNVCSNATEIPPYPTNFQDDVRTHSANDSLCEPEESCEFNAAGTGHSVWYSFTPTCDGVFGVTTNGSSYDTVLSIWSNCRSLITFPNVCSRSTELACDDDSGDGTNSMINFFNVTSGDTYLIKVAAYGTADGDRLHLSTQFMCSSPCDSVDFNGDGLFPDTQDITDFIAVFGGAPCPTGTCGDIDFNNDGLYPDTMDISAFISIFSGGPCLN